MKRETSRFRSSLSQIAETALTEPKSLQHKKKKFSQAPFQKKLFKMEKIMKQLQGLRVQANLIMAIEMIVNHVMIIL